MPLIDCMHIMKICETQVLKDAIGFSFRVRQRNTSPKTCNDLEIGSSTIFRRRTVCGLYGLPDLGRRTRVGSITRKNEVRRQNANDRLGIFVERDCLSDRLGISSEFRVPEFVGHNHRVAFTGTKGTTAKKWSARASRINSRTRVLY